MKRKAFGLIFFGLLFGIVWLALNKPHQEVRRALFQREAATYVLGQYLTKKFPARPILIASNPFTKLSGRPAQIYQFEAAGLDGFRKAFGEKTAFKIAYPDLRPGAVEHPEDFYLDPQSKTPLSFLVADNGFDTFFAANPDCKICATLIGLPSSITQTPCWRDPTLKFALLLPDWRLLGDSETIRKAFKSEKIVAAVVDRPGLAIANSTDKRDFQKTFDQHFLLITPDNCDELISRYRRLF